MGQPASTLAGHGPRAGARGNAVPPHYTPLCETIKPGDPAAAAGVTGATEDAKDALSKILEFGPALRFLPPEVDTGAPPPPPVLDAQLQEILSSVDSTSELFQFISHLAAMPPGGTKQPEAHGPREPSLSGFDARVAQYVKTLQGLYQLTKREKQRYEQRLHAARTQATSQRKVMPPPLPLPTQNCMAMGWDLVVHLLRATRVDNPQHYLRALQMIKESLLALKPTAYADGMYLAPSASSSFNLLSDCLAALAYPPGPPDASPSEDTAIGAATMETLAEVALARGSLSTLLHVVLWLFEQEPETPVNLCTSLAKLAALKEQQLYGKCEASGELYCCGQNSYGELGIGDDIERHQLTSVSLCGWDDVRQVVSGNEMLAILTNCGVVLTCGLNKSGQCGHGHFDERVMLLRPVQALRTQRIKFIAASNGCEHVIALTEQGLAYSWGYNDRGQLGHENVATKIHLPKLIEALKDKKLTYAAVSYHHSGVVTEAGDLYTFGMNDCGQLGLDHTQHMSTPQLVKALDGHEVSMVSCGLYHTVVCSATGELFTFGKNDYGQLGLGHSRQVKLPALVPLPNEMVSFVACGYYHSVVVTTTGHTYSFGRNDYGQLGIGSKVHQNAPNVIALSASTRMTRGTCGCYHTVLLSEQGQVFVFGRNNKGQLGNRSSADSLLPVPLKVRPEKNNRRCVDVAAGFYTTSLIFERKRENEEGDVIVLDQHSLVTVCGRVDIDRSGEIEGLSNFGSVSTVGVGLFEGKWFYEVEVVSSGLIQIGWIDHYFQGSSDQGEGVGDHTHSWSYDGNRQRRWNSGSSSYGEKWKAGDVIGCLLDLDAHEMSFYRNGISLGVAFTDVRCNTMDKRSGFMPGISLERGEIIRVNLGHQPFAYPPTNVGEFDAVFKAISNPAASTIIRPSPTSGIDTPPVLEGSATVLVNSKVFVIGGCASGSPDATNQVWCHDMNHRRWERWTDFPIAVRFHQAVAIDDAHILVIGGENSTPTSRHMDLYRCSTLKGADGSLPAWELIQGAVGATAALPVPRAHHIAAAIRIRLDSMVFLYGGKSAENETLGDIWFLSLEDYSWSRLPSSMALDPGPRIGCTSTVIGESVYIFGGQDKEEKFRADLWRYNTFDRVWHLCHDDNIVTTTDVVPDGETVDDNYSRPSVPESRINYSIASDLGNVWLYGGESSRGNLLNDCWCYSITSQKWTKIDLVNDNGMSGASAATIIVPYGTTTALAHVVEGSARGGSILIFGGRIQTDTSTLAYHVYEMCPGDFSRAFVVDTSMHMSTSGKSANMLSVLRMKCATAAKSSQHCLSQAMDSGVCVLSHLDRLAGNDIPGDEVETIQLSRCSYRSLCVDPKDSTFSALNSLLVMVTRRLEDVEYSVLSSDDQSALVTQVLYPLLVCIRLLKLNFFELSRCGLEPAEIGLSSLSNEPGGVLHSIRVRLFSVAEHECDIGICTGEACWYYRAVKHEAAAALYQGFSALYPSLLERLEVMNKLMQHSTSDAASTPTKQLLVPMLVPCFTSPKMLFELMNETPTNFVSTTSSLKATTVVTEFMSTVLESLWVKTNDIVADFDRSGEAAATKLLSELDSSAEFKCLNSILRACIFWCSCSTEQGWIIAESVILRLVAKFVHLLEHGAELLANQIAVLPHIVQHSFPAKLLPFALLSVTSLSSVRDNLARLLRLCWPGLEHLLKKIHSILCVIDNSPASSTPHDHIRSSELNALPETEWSDQTKSCEVALSDELRVLLKLPVSVNEVLVLNTLWNRLVSSDTVSVKQVGSGPNGVDLVRISLPPDIGKMFCCSSLLVLIRARLGQDVSSIKASDVSFAPSRLVLSQHIWSNGTFESKDVSSTQQLSSSPFGVVPLTYSKTPSNQFRHSSTSRQTYDEGLAWLRDVQKMLVWVGSHYAAVLVIGSSDGGVELDEKWAKSPLFRSGLSTDIQVPSPETSRLSNVKDVTDRNVVLLQQIVDNVGSGRKVVEKVKHALDPSSNVGGSNPKLLAARLKRQDSVEAALEKSGGIEVVDKAVRVAFAALLKHCHTAYVPGAIDSDGIPCEPVVDAWRSALHLRRWIVREQQKLASETGPTNLFGSDSAMKERQQALYTAVCEPLIRRGQFLLSLNPASTTSSDVNVPKPFKLLPGISAATVYDTAKGNTTAEHASDFCAANQLRHILETKTTEVIEQEDEHIQTDIFAFLQFSEKSRTTVVEEGCYPPDLVQTATTTLQSHRSRAEDRFLGLQIFRRMLIYSETNTSCRQDIIPALSTAFKRTAQQIDSSEVHDKFTCKAHYLDDVELAGPAFIQEITTEYYGLLATLIQLAGDHICRIRKLFDSTSLATTFNSSSAADVQRSVHEVIQIFEASSIPFKDNDWAELLRIKYLDVFTDLSNWQSWKAMVQLDLGEDTQADLGRGESYPILPASISQKCPRILCSKGLTIGTDLHQLTLSHRLPTPGTLTGGLAVFNHPFYRGRWYWEVILTQCGPYPVYVGVVRGTDELGSCFPDRPHGISLHTETSGPMELCHGHQVMCQHGEAVGILLNCDEKKLEVYINQNRVSVVSLESPEWTSGGGYYAAVGVKEAEVLWNLAAPVPEKLWAESVEFQFSSPLVSGCLVAAPFDGRVIGWDAKSKGRQLSLSSDGTTVVANASSAHDFETIIANHGFTESEALFAEVHILSPGQQGRCELAFGIVGSDFTSFDTAVAPAAELRTLWPEEAVEHGVFGVLFDFSKRKVTVFPNAREPYTCESARHVRGKLFPALSVLCNGLVIHVSFHPRIRPELPLHVVRATIPSENSNVTAANDIQVGKLLQMTVQSCDGGEFSASHSARNCLVDDSSVFSSANGSNVNLVLRHEVDTPFCLSYLSVRGPGPGYSSPLRHALVFVTSSTPSLKRLQAFDNFTPEQFAALPYPIPVQLSDRDEDLPVAYFVLDGSCSHIGKQLSIPVMGRFIVVKFLRPSTGSNIDVGYVGCFGTFDKENGPAYADNAQATVSCEECRSTPLHGVYYAMKDDINTRLCAVCYDDNRGRLDVPYFAHVGMDGDSQNDDCLALCSPRKLWLEKLSTQISLVKRSKGAAADPTLDATHRAVGFSNTSVGRGDAHERTLVWFDDCELFSCGQNNYGELCLGHCNSTSKLEHVPFFSAKSVREIAGGNEVLAVLLKDGTLFTCGLNKSGQCGNGTFEERVLVATPVRALSGIAIDTVAAANGCEHMLAVAADGSVYSWGYNDRGQLGLGSTISKSHTPRLIESLRDKYSITCAAVSYHHSAVVSSSGELLTFGMNDCGQLGLDHTQHQHTPQLVDALSSQVVKRVACGLYHTVVTTATGELYAFGKNDYGQLGLGHARNVKLPTNVRVAIGENDEKIVDVSCGYYHTVAITDKGKLMTWGRNDYGQLGIGSKDHKNSPQYVPLPLSSRIRKASCGCYHTLILLGNGRVMVFGRNNKGQLGAGARTLPSADLPLPIPSNSLTNDEVVCIAAGFYSSYILTGRSSQSREPELNKDDQTQTKDTTEQSAEALYESLMKEIDRNQVAMPPSVLPIQIKRYNMRRKFPLLKLHAAAWAVVRALMYQAVNSASDNREHVERPLTVAHSKSKRYAVLSGLVEFLLTNLSQLQPELGGRVDKSLGEVSRRLDDCLHLKNACVGLLMYCFAKNQIAGLYLDQELNTLHPYFYRNQLLWVLLRCGSADPDVCSMMASNQELLTVVLQEMNSTDLASGAISIRLAMLIFPLLTVASVNAAYKNLSLSSSSDVLTMLMLLIGKPLVTRPRLCNHELGIERGCSSLCDSANCLKGLMPRDDSNNNLLAVQDGVLEQSHVAVAKSAEALILLRYLALFPAWKIAINSIITRSLIRSEKLNEVFDVICSYYTSIQHPMQMAHEDATEAMDTSQVNDSTAQQGSVRQPESTTLSPEVDCSDSTDDVKKDSENRDQPDTMMRDKRALMIWKKAKDALDALGLVLAAVAIIGGHVEAPREGGIVIVDELEHKWRGRFGVLSSLRRDARGDMVANVSLLAEQGVSARAILHSQGTASSTTVPVKNVRVVEQIPALLDMFESIDSIISSLSLLVLPSRDEFSPHIDLDQPQNNSVQLILGRKLRLFKKQLQWRATKALSSLLKQIPHSRSSIIQTGTQLLSNIAQTISAEDIFRNSNTVASLRADERLNGRIFETLHARWLGVKQRQTLLDTEAVLDMTLDFAETNVREAVVTKLGQENALSWGLDAIQSPRKATATSSSLNGKINGHRGSVLGGNLKPFHSRSPLDYTTENRRTAFAGMNSLPNGAWGVLHPLPQLNESDGTTTTPPAAIDFSAFHLTTPIIRVGRAADSCDLIVNDRSVSGRHFHLRRVRRDQDSAEEYFELQDFSKNGTIVNGVRVHGTSVRVTSGSRISLILSRGGLVTYEFQARPVQHSTMIPSTGSHGRVPPPPIVTATTYPASGEGNPSLPIAGGQDYQMPAGYSPSPIEPRSPAEIQNRGTRHGDRGHHGMDAIRSRLPASAQGLRLITSIAESEVPRALISPNPAVESPRVGGFSSPRSSILQAPGTPAISLPPAGLFSSASVLSPASYQQRESSASTATDLSGATSIRPPESTGGDGLRIALARESLHRENRDPPAFKSFSDTHDPPLKDMNSAAMDTLDRLHREGLTYATIDHCLEAHRIAGNDTNAAYGLAREQLMHSAIEEITLPGVGQLSALLGKSPAVCAEALRQTHNNLAAAMRLLMSPAGCELETSRRQTYGLPSTVLPISSIGRCGDVGTAESLVNIQEMMDENASYALADNSAEQQLPRARPSSPNKSRPTPSLSGRSTRISLWIDAIFAADDRLAQMSAVEVDDEELILGETLTALYSRKLVQDIVRLFSEDKEQSDNLLAAFGDPVTLRHLILFPSQDDLSSTPISDAKFASMQPDDSINQNIVTRVTSECIAKASSRSTQENLCGIQALSKILIAMDRRDQWAMHKACLSKLLRTLLCYENNVLKDDGSGQLRLTNILQHLLSDTLFHTLSRTFVHQGSLLNWEATMINKSRRPEAFFPKGPIQLSSGIECMVVTTYDRVWSVPTPDPLVTYRRKWRKRQAAISANPRTGVTAVNGAVDAAFVTIWRPAVPSGVKAPSKLWCSLGDVIRMGGEIPDGPILLVHDDGSGTLRQPLGFERVDVTGKGLPKNSEHDPAFQRKQVRSLWWPVAPPGYVSIGCFAGSKEEPFLPPDASVVRCVREDLVQRADSVACLWRAETRAALGVATQHHPDESGQQSDVANMPDVTEGLVHTSLWTVMTPFCNTILPVVSLEGAQPAIDPVSAFTINLSPEDRILCSPVSVSNVLSFVRTLYGCRDDLSDDPHSPYPEDVLRPELASALFLLLQQVLREKLPGCGQTAVRLVRALIGFIQRGGKWESKRGSLFCRSKIMALQQDQEGGLLLNSLLQAFIELMLVVEDQNRPARIQELQSCLDGDGKSTIHLPYKFIFARDSHKEMLVSHSSKMAVTRHFSGEERKFLLTYHADDAAALAPAPSNLDTAVTDHYSCRFEHTPALVMSLKDDVKAEIIYYEVTVMEWSPSATSTPGHLGFGFSPPEFALEGLPVGLNTNDIRTYSFTPVSGKIQSPDATADHWRWNDQTGAVAVGEIYGCGLRLDTQEVFFTKNGQLLGTAFSSIDDRVLRDLHPTISVNTDCKLLINFGSNTTSGDSATLNRVSFAFRFNTMDYDNIMGGFEWYEHLSQVYGVMKSLMDVNRENPAHGGLPDEFMLSADNFLSEISEDVCVRVESSHPYDLDLQEAVVSIPLAASIRVKLDAQCETANSHCLQILQGGDSAESSESEVRAFTGGCGGQEVMIEGDSFIWRFPVQSNFQCRVDRVRKGPYLKLENRDTRLSLTRDKGWQTAIGVARFDSGVHIWEVRITFVTASSNIFLGIARRDVRLDSYLGKDNRGWGWIGNRALWHNGSKQRGTYGEKFKTGDVVRMTLDLKRGTLSYALNGKDLGVAFGPGGVGPKLEGTFYPGVALYNQRDSIDLIGGHRVEDGDSGLMLSGSGLPAGGDEVYYSEDDDEAIGDVDDGIPNFRMELATALSQMGFPMDWCVYALRHCEDDAEQAADFILANMHVMEALVREEAEAHSRRLRHREAQASAVATVNMVLPPPAPGAITAPMGSETSQVDIATGGGSVVDQPVDGDVGSTDESITLGDNATAQNIDKWGIAFTAVPEFSVTGRRLLAAKYHAKLQYLHASQAVFTSEHDNAIVQIVNEICEARAEALLSCDPLRMAPEEFLPTEEHFRRFPCLHSFPVEALQKRFLILRNFNCRLQNSLSFIDFSVADSESLLAQGTRRLRGIIFQHVKLAWWLNILKEQQSPAAARPEIEVDRHRAREATESTGIKESVFAQCFDQLHTIQPSLLRGADRAFKCQFVGEFGDDFGGLYRECLAQISSELQSRVLPVLKPCPNAINLVGENREQFIPNAHLRQDARLVQMAEFLGKLIGIAIRTKTPLDLNLPEVFWKTIVGQAVGRKDVESIHHGCFQIVDTINNVRLHGITEAMFEEIVDANFSVVSSARQVVDLVPGGRDVRVTWEDRDAFARLVEAYRLGEFAPICDDITRGIATILPAPTLGLFTWRELATLVCGKPTVDVELLRRRTIYGDGCQATDPHIAYFWEVINEFTDEQKSSFLRFVWGRSRLPTHAADFTQDFKISGLPKAAGRPDAYLPIAHTCFFSIDLPNYTSREVMRDKLLYAITHCQSIDADNTTVAQRAGQGLNWTAPTTTATAAPMGTVPISLVASTTATSAAVATAAAAVSSVIAGLASTLGAES